MLREKKMLFVYNPKSGKTQIKNKLADIVDIFVKAGYEVTVYPTQYRQDAIRVAMERGRDYQLLVCSGGDGTLDEIVTGMIKSGFTTPLGYIPAGSTNDFANSLHLPKAMIKAAQTVIEGKPFACDLGSFNDDVFVYIAAFGLFTDVSYETNQDVKNVLGHMAYLLEGMKRLSMIKSYQMTCEHDGQIVTGDFLYGMVTNSLSVGGFKSITGKYVELDDGEFEVTLVRRPTNPLEMNDLLRALMDREINNNSICAFKTSKLKLICEKAIPWTLDGEYGGDHKEVCIENLNKVVEIIVPDIG